MMHNLKISWCCCLSVLAAAVVMMTPDIASALGSVVVVRTRPAGFRTPVRTATQVATSGGTIIGTVLCTASDWFRGNTGKGLATLGISTVGLGAMLGKISWGLAILIGIGTAVIFGAVLIADSMGAGTSVC